MFSYERLEVYLKAYQANQKIYRLLKRSRVIAPYAKNQLGSASLSIMLNIAEGSAKFSNKDRRNFYVTARGSAFECASLLCFLHEEGEVDSGMTNDLYDAYEEISKMLFTMIKNLKDR